MKKFYVFVALIAFVSFGVVSCTPEKLNEDSEVYQSDKDEEPEDKGNG